MRGLLLVVVSLASCILPCAATVRKTLVITNELGAPDGQQRYHIKVNGQMPGPPLYFDEDADVEITVENRMAENTTLHLHGLLQQGTPWSDGVPGLSQKPIEPGKSFVYRFRASPAGTYWYHGHSRSQIWDGWMGAMLIRRKKDTPRPWSLISSDPKDIKQMEKAAKDPALLMLADWDKYTSTEYMDVQRKTGLQFFCSDSILTNGKGSVLCPPYEQVIGNMSDILKQVFAPNNVTDKGCFPLVFETEGPALNGSHPEFIPPGLQEGCVAADGGQEVIGVDAKDGWVSLNFIGALTMKSLRVQVDEHPMWVYEVDGQLIEPRLVDVFDINAAERYSVMVKLDKPGKDYTLRFPDSGLTQIISGYATLRYKRGKDKGPSKPYLAYNGENLTAITELNTDDLPPFPPEPVGQQADVTHLMQVDRWTNVYEWTMSGKSKYPVDWHSYDPFLFSPNHTDAFNDSLVIRTNHGQWVDLVIEFGAKPYWNELLFAHPIHKHGTKFWLLGHLDEPWIWNTTAEAIAARPGQFNLVNPPYRDTTRLGQFGTPAFGVLRYHATNPGPWLIHCHVDTHMSEGLAMVLMDGVDNWPTIPKEYQGDRGGRRH